MDGVLNMAQITNVERLPKCTGCGTGMLEVTLQTEQPVVKIIDGWRTTVPVMRIERIAMHDDGSLIEYVGDQE
jgi:hypothetical protein